MNDNRNAKASAFKALHAEGVLVLPNAWDAGSAALIARSGARAVATTSGGVSWALGRPDGQALTREEMAGQVRRICAAVDLPVTADIEGGYGPDPDDVAATVAAMIDAGAVGVNIEDSVAPGQPLFGSDEQSRRLRAARSAAEAAGVPDLVVNARTDVYLFGIGAEEDRFDDVVARAEAYAEAGADCLFVPGLVDLEAVAALVKAVPLPVNVMAGPGAPTVAEFEAAGARRVSVGTAISQAAYSLAQRVAVELVEHGTYGELAGALDYMSLNSVFGR
ncbi:isocitrate lyase/phosphoenolpyruvate mutase family protein [Actinokineospora sp. UTMC 2448]|uniref:isocitrate lyase/PEP mutase family protein n=1 Tax=Actinokineospora sp. UTMC 2448 TaxID=2268449 RepID=UPI002164EFFF|nr:isocitrate lyase/phosphoenolpyruvate mutase family protein [Actinokineospora sp. UTMC 2448]UVS80438.1 Carboxyvinyl-carboxyphosphonate phosphorylmutase [Actinokineospora sp. UTMC 2448]